MKKKFFMLLTLALLSIGSAWADQDVLSSPTASTTTHTSAKGIVTITDTSGNTGIQSGSTLTTGKTGMKLSANRLFKLTYASGYTITKVTLLGRINNGDAGTLGTSSSDKTSLGTLPASSATPAEIDITGVETLCASAQFVAYITVEYQAAGEPVTMSFSVTSATAELGSDFTEPTLSVDPIEAKGLVTYSSSNTSVADVNSSTGAVTIKAAGSTKITATIPASDTYANATATYTLTVVDPTAIQVIYSPAKNSEFAGGEVDKVMNGDEEVATVTYSDSGAPKAMTFNKDFTASSFTPSSGYTFNALTEGNGANGNADGGTYYIIAPKYDGTINIGVLISGVDNKDLVLTVEEDGAPLSGFEVKKIKYYGIETFSVKGGSTYKCYVSGSKMGFYGFYYTYSKAVKMTITDAGWATLYTGYALDFSKAEGLTAYTATCDGETVELTEVADVPANTGVVLKGEAKSYSIPVITESNTSKGDLTGSTTKDLTYDNNATSDYYMLALNKEGMAQFTKLISGTITAGKAYLELEKTAGESRVLNVVIAGETTGINETIVNNEKATGTYNLNGQRVAQPTKGLYIVNGKKVIIK